MENPMNSIFAGVTSITLALLLSAQISSPAKTSAPANQKRLHRVAVQVDVNDPAVMNLALNNVSNVAQHYREIGEKVEIEVVAFGPDYTCCEMTPLPSKRA
jgi:uncharacterized protein